MSGIIGSKINIRGSGKIAKLGTDGQVLTSAGAGLSAAFEDLAAGITWQAIETGSTMTAVAGEGYWVDTTSNTCTITLPASASNGDTIIFADYARTWGTYKIIIDSNGLNYQGDDDTFTVEYTTDGQAVKIVYSDATNGWIPITDDDVADAPAPPRNTKGVFAYGDAGGYTAISNKVSNVGVVASDTAGVGTARGYVAAAEYSSDKGIFGFGTTGSNVSMTNLVSNAGVIATDTTGVGTARNGVGAARYGGDKGVFAYGITGSAVSLKNLVSNVGVMATDVTGVGTARYYPAACEYSANQDKAIFGYGNPGNLSMTNLVSNAGVIATDVTGVGTGRYSLAACAYSSDKGIFGYGSTGSDVSMTNLVTNVGVVGTDVTGVGTARNYVAATQYGQDKGLFGFGDTSTQVGMTNLISNVGVVATDVTAVGTARSAAAASSY